MDNNTVIKLLTDYRSYKFALMNLGVNTVEREPFGNLPVYEERKPYRLSNYDESYDRNRYSRIISTLESAVEFVLSDEQREIIQHKYMDRNTINLNQIADKLHVHRTTVKRHHNIAINRLSKALLPISREYMEINNIDHMFDPTWIFREPA